MGIKEKTTMIMTSNNDDIVEVIDNNVNDIVANTNSNELMKDVNDGSNNGINKYEDNNNNDNEIILSKKEIINGNNNDEKEKRVELKNDKLNPFLSKKGKVGKLDLASKLKKSLKIEKKEQQTNYGLMMSLASFSDDVTRDLIDQFGGVVSGDVKEIQLPTEEEEEKNITFMVNSTDPESNENDDTLDEVNSVVGSDKDVFPVTSSDMSSFDDVTKNGPAVDNNNHPNILEECNEMYSMASFSNDTIQNLSTYYAGGHNENNSNDSSNIINHVDDNNNDNENFILEEEESVDMMSVASFTIDDDDKVTTTDGASVVHCDEDNNGTSHDDGVKANDETHDTVQRNTTSDNSFQMMMKEKTLLAVKSKYLQIDFSRLSNSGSGDLFVKSFEESIAELFSSSFAKSSAANYIDELNNSSAGILMASSGYCSFYNNNSNLTSSLDSQALAA